MANDSIDDDLKVLSETDLFSIISKSDYSSNYLTKTYFNNSKQQLRNSISNISIKDHLLETTPISINHMLKTQNTNAPWLFNILKKKFHRSRKYKYDRGLSKEIEMNNSILLAEELLERPISNDGTSGRWIINEKDVIFPLIKNFDQSTSGQYNVSRAISPSTVDSLHLHHYYYDFQTLETPIRSSIINKETEINNENTPIDFISIASMIKTYYTNKRQQQQKQIDTNNIDKMEMTLTSSSSSFPGILEPITEDLHMTSDNSTSTRAKSTSARTHHRIVNSNATKREKQQTKQKKNKYYQEHLLTSQEIELREALRIIDLDNIGFFPPKKFRQILNEIGIHSYEIDRIEQCLPLDEDGHYSIDNLIKLFLN